MAEAPHIFAAIVGVLILGLVLARWLRADFRRVAWYMAQELPATPVARWHAVALFLATFAVVLYGLAS